MVWPGNLVFSSLSSNATESPNQSMQQPTEEPTDSEADKMYLDQDETANSNPSTSKKTKQCCNSVQELLIRDSQLEEARNQREMASRKAQWSQKAVKEAAAQNATLAMRNDNLAEELLQLCSDHDSLQKIVAHTQDLGKRIADKTGECGSLSIQLADMEVLREQLHGKHDECDSLHKELAQMHVLTKKQQGKSSECESLCKEVARTQTLEKELRKKSDEYDSAMTSLCNLQKRIFTKAQSTWVPEDDCQIREDVSKLYKGIRSWSKVYGGSSDEISTIPQISEESIVNDLLQKSMSVANITGIEEILNMKHPFLILAALLADRLRTDIFKSPFSWLTDEPGVPTSNWLHQAFLDMCKGQVNDAHTWRAQLMRVMIGNGKGRDSDPPTPSAKMFQDCIEIRSNDLTIDFMSDSEAILLKRMETTELDRCKRELRKLVKRAMSLNARLQTQQSFYEPTQSASQIGQVYSVASGHLQADRLHKVDEDEGDTSMDGRRVKIVLSPTVLASGNSQGEYYDTRRVISKAIVYLE